MTKELPSLGTLKLPSDRKEATFWNKQALAGLLTTSVMGAVIAGFVGKGWQETEVRTGYREVNEPSFWNARAAIGWGLGQILGAIAGFALALVTHMPGLIYAGALAGGVTGLIAGGNQGKEEQEQDYKKAIVYATQSQSNENSRSRFREIQISPQEQQLLNEALARGNKISPEEQSGALSRQR